MYSSAMYGKQNTKYMLADYAKDHQMKVYGAQCQIKQRKEYIEIAMFLYVGMNINYNEAETQNLVIQTKIVQAMNTDTIEIQMARPVSRIIGDITNTNCYRNILETVYGMGLN